MSTSDQLGNIVASTLVKNYSTLCDQIFQENSFLLALQSAGIQRSNDGGDGIQVPLIVGRNGNIRSYMGYDTLPTNPTKEFGFARYPWRKWSGSLSTCGHEVCINRGSSAVFNLVQQKIEVLKQSMQDWLAEMLITSTGYGNNSKDPYGLPRILGGLTIDPISGEPTTPVLPELGGLDATDPAAAFWTAYIDDGGVNAAIAAGTPAPAARPLTEKLLQRTAFNIKERSTRMPNLIVTDKDSWLGLAAQFNPNVVQSDPNQARFGFQSLVFMGITIIWDHRVPAGTVYFLNTKRLNWDVLSGCYMQTTPWMKAINQDAQYMHILSTANLTTCERRANGILCNVKSLG